MENFIAYHSASRMGYRFEPTPDLRFRSKKLPLLRKALGNTIWVVEGVATGRTTSFRLHGAWLAEHVRPDGTSERYVISGPRVREFDPPIPLNGLAWFPEFLESQSNFSLGFNRVSDDALIEALTSLPFKQVPASPSPPPDDLDALDVDASALEGHPHLVSHLRKERKRSLIAAKKAAVFKYKGRLACEACDFDFSVAYGTLGDGFCEVHHLLPLSQTSEPVTTRLEDLAILCSNCHRVIHLSSPMLTVSELAALVTGGRP